MSISAEILSRLVDSYFKGLKGSQQDCRLVMPVPTLEIGKKLQAILHEQFSDSPEIVPLLVVDELTDPNEKAGWIHPSGVTSKRLGSMVILTLPGQLSRIQESVTGSGGTIRSMSFSDEWPWVESGNESFSFEDRFLQTLIGDWTTDRVVSDWIQLLVNQIVRALSAKRNRPDVLFNRVIDQFDPDSDVELKDIRHRLLRHCGVPYLPNFDVDASSGLKEVGRTCMGIAAKIRGTKRKEVEERAKDIIPKEEIDKVIVSLNKLFDGFGSKNPIGDGILSLSVGLKQLDLDEWLLLDLNTLCDLFQVAPKPKIEVTLTIRRGQEGVLSRSETELVALAGIQLELDFYYRISGSNINLPDYKIQRFTRRTLEETVPVMSAAGSHVFQIDTSSFENYARPVQIMVGLVDVPRSYRQKASVTLHLLGEQRPSVLINSNPFAVIDAIDPSGEEDVATVTVGDPFQTMAYLYSTQPGALQALADADGKAITLTDSENGLSRTVSHLSPSDSPSGLIELVASIGSGEARLVLESESQPRGQFSLEQELIDAISRNSRSKVTNVFNIFSGMDRVPYPGLGGITEQSKLRISLAKTMENTDDGELPILWDPDSVVELRKQGYFRISTSLPDRETQQAREINIESFKSLVEKYVSSRKEIIGYLKHHFGIVDGSAIQHPLYAYLPIFIDTEKDSIGRLVTAYLNSYQEILGYLKTNKPSDWWQAFFLTYLDCVVISRPGYPYFLLGPWHPLMVAQRYLRQESAHATAGRYVDSDLMFYGLAMKLQEFQAFHRVHALSENSIVLENAYVCGTSDSGWCAAIRTSADQELLGITAEVSRVLGIDLSLSLRTTANATRTYVKDYLSANPSRRRLSIQVQSGFPPGELITEIEGLLYEKMDDEDRPTDIGLRLPGGIHLYFEDFSALDDLGEVEWRDPPIYAYDASSSGQRGDIRSIDIILLSSQETLSFSGSDEAVGEVEIPRGVGRASAITRNLAWLEQGARGIANSVTHEVDVTGSGQGHQVSSVFLEALLSIHSLVGNSSFLVTRKVALPDTLEATWAVISGSGFDPAMLVQYVSDEKRHGEIKTLWNYRIDFGVGSGEYYVLSSVPSSFRAALAGTKVFSAPDVIEDLCREMGQLGIAIGSQALKTGTKSLGVVGEIGTARLVFGNDQDPLTSGILSQSSREIGLLIPVDPFVEVLGTELFDSGNRVRRADFLAVQIYLPPDASGSLRLSGSAIESKFTAGRFSDDSETVSKAFSQANQTYDRFSALVMAATKENGILERVLLTELLFYGLRLTQHDNRGKEVVLDRDHRLLTALVQGRIEFVEPMFKAILVSTERQLEGTSWKQSPDLWIRLSPESWPGLNEDADLRTVRAKLRENFSRVGMLPIARPEELTDVEPLQDDQQEIEEENQAPRPDDTTSPATGESVPLEPEDVAASEPPSDDTLEDSSTVSPAVTFAEDGAGVRIVVGKAIDAYPPDDFHFWPSNTGLNQLNVGIVGDLGTGKTQLVRALMAQMAASQERNQGVKPKFLVFDFKGDYTDKAFLDLIGGKLVLPSQIPLNLFDTTLIKNTVVNPASERVRFFYDVLKKIYGTLGAVQNMRIRNSLLRAYKIAEGAGRTAPTIQDLLREYEAQLPRNAADTVLSVLTQMVDQQIFATSEESIQPFGDFFDQSTVLDLRQLGQDDLTKNMLVVIFLNLFYEYMLKLEKRPFVGENPTLRVIDSILVVDEAYSIMKNEFEVLNSLLLQGREFGIGVWLASQYLSHFKAGANYHEPLLTWFVHKVPNIQERELQLIGLTGSTKTMPDKIRKLNLFECLYKTFDVPGQFMKATPFFELFEG